MKIPGEKECFRIMAQNSMMKHIVHHSVMVKEVALFLCGHLSEIHPGLNTDLVKASALLHDITKTRSFSTGEKHSETGGDLLESLGYPEIGDIVRQHVILAVYDRRAPVSEAEIVNYSDKRVLHDNVVPLDQRLEYIYENYITKAHDKQYFYQMWENTRMLEEKLFSNIAIAPDALQGLNGGKHDTPDNS